MGVDQGYHSRNKPKPVEPNKPGDKGDQADTYVPPSDAPQLGKPGVNVGTGDTAGMPKQSDFGGDAAAWGEAMRKWREGRGGLTAGDAANALAPKRNPKPGPTSAPKY